MKSYKRAFLTLAVLAGGIGLAFLFRLEQNETSPPTSEDGFQVATQTTQRTPTQSPPSSHSTSRANPIPIIIASQETAADSTQRTEPPNLSAPRNSARGSAPNLLEDRNGLDRRAQSRAAPRPVRTHKIVDGDSLQEIARQYLGSAASAGRIFEVNRDRLSDPALLPIGVELTIPSGVQDTSTTPGSLNHLPLVPVVPRPRDQSAAVGPLNR
jgi:LysM repeat protein